MSGWSSESLDRVGEAEELQIRSQRRDGTWRSPRIIWVVRLDDELYVRSVNGRGSAWFRGTRTTGRGYVEAGGVSAEVDLVEDDGSGDGIADTIADALDAAYSSKYAHYAATTLDRITSEEARAATLRLVP